MYLWMNGKESHAMTAATPYQAMIATTANTAIAITVRIAARTAGCATPQSVLDVLMNVLNVKSRFVVTVPQCARNVERRSVRTA